MPIGRRTFVTDGGIPRHKHEAAQSMQNFFAGNTQNLEVRSSQRSAEWWQMLVRCRDTSGSCANFSLNLSNKSKLRCDQHTATEWTTTGQCSNNSVRAATVSTQPRIVASDLAAFAQCNSLLSIRSSSRTCCRLRCGCWRAVQQTDAACGSMVSDCRMRRPMRCSPATAGRI